MTPWGEQTQEDYADETTYGESPFGESYEQPAQTEWDSPFATTGSEEETPFGQEQAREALSPGGAAWETPFASSGLAGESEIMVGPTGFRGTCAPDENVTYTGKPWPYGKPFKNKTGGKATALSLVPRAEVMEFQLTHFDVDRHELKNEHRQAIQDFANRILAGIRSNKYTGEPIRIYTYGEASSTAGQTHNLRLSGNRAYNTLNAIRCHFKSAGVTYPILYGLYGTGEQESRVSGPDQKEDPNFRGVIVRAFAPIKEKVCDCPPPTIEPTKPTAICVSVPRIAPRAGNKIPPDVIPLAPIIPGLRLPIAIVTRAQATVRVDDRRSRQNGQYAFTGWGLEVALPAGRTRIDLRAELRASLEVLVRASQHLGARLQLGPLKLSLRVDVSVFAQLIVKLCAQLRLRLEADLGSPNIPELRECRFLEARNVRGPFPFAALSGPAVLIVPGAGYGPAVLTLGGPGVPALGLPSNVMQVPADKSTVRTLLALGGNLAPSQPGIHRETEEFDTEWPQAFEEEQSEMVAPFA